MEWRKKVKKFPISWGSAKLRSLEGDHSIWAKAWAAAAPSQIPMSSQHELRKPFCLKMLPAHLTWLPTSPPSCFFIILHRKTGKLGSQTRQGEEAGTLGRPGERFASCHVSERGTADLQTRTAPISALLSRSMFAERHRNQTNPDLETDVLKAN